MKATFSILASFLIAGSVGAQNTISGIVTDAGSGLPLPGATVMLVGTTTGAVTDGDGTYRINDLPLGTYNIQVSFVGYEAVLQPITLQDADITFDIALQVSSQALEALELFASRALNRQTPVAYSDIEKLQVERELAGRG